MRQPSSTAVLDGKPRDHAPSADVQQVAPLSYTQLRLLAECAAGLSGQVNFVFTERGELQATRSPDPAGVLVPAYGEGKYPENCVWLQVGDSRTPGERALKIGAGFADAVFWSDAAVQKFLFPYVTSCAGSGAARTMARLQAAWNHYPAARVSVYALVHVVDYRAMTDLSLENAIHVVYAERRDGGAEPDLVMAPLAEFLEAHPPVASPADAWRHAEENESRAGGVGGNGRRGAVDYQRGAADAAHPYQQPGYATLRALAEFACSIRQEPRYFLLKQGEDGFRPFPTRELPPVSAGDLVIPAHTPAVPALRPRLNGVWCHTRGAHAPNLAGMADAVFWSNGAIEQFLYPYYASKGGLREGLKELMELSYMWTGQVPPGLGRDGEHGAGEAENQAENQKEGGDGSGTGSSGGQVTVTGTVHIITSEYVTEAQAAALGLPVTSNRAVSRLPAGHELAVMYEGGGGETLVTSMAEFRARYWPRPG